MRYIFYDRKRKHLVCDTDDYEIAVREVARYIRLWLSVNEAEQLKIKKREGP